MKRYPGPLISNLSTPQPRWWPKAAKAEGGESAKNHFSGVGGVGVGVGGGGGGGGDDDDDDDDESGSGAPVLQVTSISVASADGGRTGRAWGISHTEARSDKRGRCRNGRAPTSTISPGGASSGRRSGEGYAGDAGNIGVSIGGRRRRRPQG